MEPLVGEREVGLHGARERPHRTGTGNQRLEAVAREAADEEAGERAGVAAVVEGDHETGCAAVGPAEDVTDEGAEADVHGGDRGVGVAALVELALEAGEALVERLFGGRAAREEVTHILRDHRVDHRVGDRDGGSGRGAGAGAEVAVRDGREAVDLLPRVAVQAERLHQVAVGAGLGDPHHPVAEPAGQARLGLAAVGRGLEAEVRVAGDHELVAHPHVTAAVAAAGDGEDARADAADHGDAAGRARLVRRPAGAAGRDVRRAAAELARGAVAAGPGELAGRERLAVLVGLATLDRLDRLLGSGGGRRHGECGVGGGGCRLGAGGERARHEREHECPDRDDLLHGGPLLRVGSLCARAARLRAGRPGAFEGRKAELFNSSLLKQFLRLLWR